MCSASTQKGTAILAIIELQCSARADSNRDFGCSRHLGTGVHNEVLDDFIEEHLPDDIRVLIMTGSQKWT